MLSSCVYGLDPSKEDKGSTFLAQSAFCFGPFLAGYLTRNVSWVYLFTKTTFIETLAIFCPDYLLKCLYSFTILTDAMSYFTNHNHAFKTLWTNMGFDDKEERNDQYKLDVFTP